MYGDIADLSLAIDRVDFVRAERDTSSDFTRVTTTIAFEGDDRRGAGEDVTYDADDHDTLAADPPALPVPFRGTLDEFSRSLDDVALFEEPPVMEASRKYRRWGVESAALDLALRQNDTDLASVLGETFDAVRFVVSTRLGDPPRADRIVSLLSTYPDTEFKLDPVAGWTDDLVEELVVIDRVRILDLKGAYEGTDVDQSPAPDLYRRVIEAFPEAIIEDPAVTPETEPILALAADRISWDAPITDVGDLETRPIDPAWLNVKPSRFGTVRSVLETIDYCRDQGIRMYGGGQFELAVGRSQIQALASLFYADAPNDVAPGGYNDITVRSGLPTSPLRPPGSATGFTFD